MALYDENAVVFFAVCGFKYFFNELLRRNIIPYEIENINEVRHQLNEADFAYQSERQLVFMDIP